ncbi:type IV pilin N-terminal domain-containing protein [Halobaculum marinum]|uniref:Type IV pilin N-terminal domain-containing protein n=1 Tax=Halobaculum marinum TaxID=3031996 RepID=A0ABD5X0H7_9EURY|nr:type IV pilin N-terminal domain-containing protein [Halobaculum sp. DT55]
MARPSRRRGPLARANASVVGVAVLVAAAVALSATVASAAFALTPAEPAPVAAVDVSVSGATVTLTHAGGDALDVRTLRVVVAVDGTPLRHQPSVPFFAQRGFRSGPTGPFNSAADPRWTAGETASFALAGTNRPQIEPGTSVEVTVYRDGRRLVTATVSGGA